MYCKKCGKEISSDSAFCPSCGAPSGETGRSAGARTMGFVTDEERNAKAVAVTAGGVVVLLKIIFTVAVLVSQFGFLTNFFNYENLSSEQFASALNSNWVIPFLLVLFAIAAVFETVFIYIIPLMNRSFHKRGQTQFVGGIFAAIAWIFMAVYIDVQPQIRITEFGLSIFFWAAALEIVAGALYRRAADIEENYISKS